LALTIYALVDCAQDDDVERTSVPKVLWMVLIILVSPVGPIAWLVVSKIARPRHGGRAAGGSWPAPGRSPRRSGPVAPDDDPDFLRSLAEEQARRRREQLRGEAGSADSTGQDADRGSGDGRLGDDGGRGSDGLGDGSRADGQPGE
jgi:hypothetical protein